MPNLTYGAPIRVKLEAPERFKPGTLGSIFSITESENETFAKNVGAEIGELAYGIEFSDGSWIEIPAKWVEYWE